MYMHVLIHPHMVYTHVCTHMHTVHCLWCKYTRALTYTGPYVFRGHPQHFAPCLSVLGVCVTWTSCITAGPLLLTVKWDWSSVCDLGSWSSQ